MKRTIYRLKWDKRQGLWVLHRSGKEYMRTRMKKRQADGWARGIVRGVWETYATPTQLLIYNKNGRIGAGGRSEASYGADSRRRRG